MGVILWPLYFVSKDYYSIRYGIKKADGFYCPACLSLYRAERRGRLLPAPIRAARCGSGAAVHVSIGALVYDVTLKDDGVEVERRPFALYANALEKQYPVKKVFLKGDAYKVESLAKILLKEGWTKGASLQPEETAVFLHALGEKKFHPVPAASGNTAVCKALNKACYEACLKEPGIS